MSDLTDKFAGLQSQMASEADEAHSQRVSIETTLEDIQTAVSNLNADLLTMKQQLLAAQGQTDPCATCPPPSLITPVTSPTVNPIDEDKCKRVQALINAVHEITGVIGAATNSLILWTPSIIISGINEVITTLVTGGTVPLPSFGEAVNIATKAISYGVQNIGRGDDLQAQFDSISGDMVNALYSSGSPGDAQTAYNAIISGSALPSDEQLLIGAIGFNDLFSYFLDPSSTPDLTPYDGTVCSFPSGTCYTLVSELVCVPALSACEQGTVGSFGPFVANTVVNSSSGELTWDKATFYAGDLTGWTIETLVGQSQVQYRAGDLTSSGTFSFTFPQEVDGIPAALPAGTGSFHIRDGSAFTVRICKA